MWVHMYPGHILDTACMKSLVQRDKTFAHAISGGAVTLHRKGLEFSPSNFRQKDPSQKSWQVAASQYWTRLIQWLDLYRKLHMIRPWLNFILFIEAAVPKLTAITKSCGYKALIWQSHFSALLDAAILNHAQTHVIQNGSAQKNQ